MAEEYRIKFLQTPDIPKTPVGEEPTAGSVTSVNGKTGAVTLRASDVGALPDSTVIPPAVTEQTVSGWGFTKNTGTYSKPSGGIPKSDLASGVQTSLGKADTALQTAPVTSVNNKTGAVTLDASDVHALPDSTVIPSVPQMATAAGMSDWTSGKTVDAAVLKAGFQNALAELYDVHGEVARKANASDIPTAVSDLTNDSGYQTAAQVQTAIEPFVIPITGDEDNWTTTASAADIVDHADNCVMNVYGANYAPQAVTKYEQTANIQTVLCVIQYGMLFSQNIEVYADKSNNSITISVELASANLLPTVTASDNGKFLRVVSGAWAAASLPSAESNSFGGGS